ncbi:hypothetical protein R5R35_013104 [Gryllus longicercus]|uniref:PHD-type domain-containing protein n=1 Tax=Gryllus longicercus TaxID=2509291 RepID=A0AAN9VZP0_9ORTH
MGSYLQEYRARIGAWAGRLSSCAARAYHGPATWRGDGALGAVSLSATVIAILLVIGGIEQNPGPVASAASACEKIIRIVCRGCGKNLSSGWRCGSCGDWFHKTCGNVKRGNVEGWVCPKCKVNYVQRLEEELRSARREIADLKVANKALNEQLTELRDKTDTPSVPQPVDESARGSCLILGDSIVRHVAKQDNKLRVECLPGIRTEQLKRFCGKS